MIVDAARLWSAQQQGLFQPVKSDALAERIPASMRDPDGNWFGFSSRARVIVYNKAAVKAADVADVRVARRSEEQGQDLHALGQPSVQPVAGRCADRAQRRSEDRGVGERRGRQHGAHAARRRHRPDQGRGRRRMRDRAVEHLLLRAPAALDQARGQGDGGEDRRRVAGPGELRHAHQHLRRRRAEECAASRERDQVPRVSRERPGAGLFRQRQQRVAGGEGRGGEESRARIARHVQGRHVPIATLGKNTPAAQKLLDRAGWK